MTDKKDSIPDWIKPKLFENVVHQIVGDYGKIVNFKVYPALPPGENYATIMLKLEIEVLLKNDATHKLSLMLKVAHDSDLHRNEMSKWDMFGTESGMYHEVVPELEKILANVGLKVTFGAESYKLPTQKEYILLENLLLKGFRNAPRQNCLDLEHCKAVLKKLAQWHAASAVRIETEGPYEYKYAKGMIIESGKEIFKSMLDSSFKHLLNSARKLPNRKEYLQQLESLQGNITELIYKQSGIDENEFNILNHGDCWSNNIMFQYDKEGKILETYFVDLQMTCYGSPAQDLLYFIFSSAQLDIKVNKFDYMIRYYHDNLIDHLKLLEYKKPLPKLKELHRSLIKHGQWGFFAALVTMAAVLCDSTEKASIDNFVSDCEEADQFKALMFSNERYLKHLEVTLPWFCHRGAFEIPR